MVVKSPLINVDRTEELFVTYGAFFILSWVLCAKRMNARPVTLKKSLFA